LKLKNYIIKINYIITREWIDAYSTIKVGEDMYNKHFLTNREKEIFLKLVENYDTKMIAEDLNISEKTVRNHISNVIQKLGVKGRSQAILELIKMGEVSID